MKMGNEGGNLKKRGAIENELSLMGQELDILGDKIKTLEDCLQSILTLPEPKTDSEKNPEAQLLVPLAADIRRKTAAVTRANLTIDSILRRLEL